MVIHVMETAGVRAVRENPEIEGYLSGQSTGLVSALHIDSLAAMELCIEIENRVGVSLTPHMVSKVKNLKSLENLIFPPGPPVRD